MRLSESFDAALAFASDLHREQKRKSTDTPYISHLFAVCSMVLEDGGSEADAIAAILHDAVEDQGGRSTLEEIEKIFGKTVATAVDTLSDCYSDEPKPPWKERKECYLSQIESAPTSVLRIALADKLHNLSSILRDHRELGDEVWSRFNPSAGPDGQLWYYQECLRIFQAKGLQSRWMTEFEESVKDLEKIIV